MSLLRNCVSNTLLLADKPAGTVDTFENNVLRKLRERKEAEKKAAEDAALASASVKSTRTLVDDAAEAQRQREADDRRIGAVVTVVEDGDMRY